MSEDKSKPSIFEFPPEPEDTVRLHLSAKDLKVLEDTSKQPKLDAGFNPYDTGVHRALVFEGKTRKKPASSQ